MSKQNKPNNDRRKLLKHGSLAAGGVAAFAAGYADTVVNAVKGFTQGSAGHPPKHAVRGNSLTPEFTIDEKTGELRTQPGQVVSPSLCLGCWTQCGVRVRVDQENNQILRIAGNPYHPLATTKPAPMELPVREVYAKLGTEYGLEGRATSCARGSAMQEQVDNPYRVLTPLKRVGKRGEGKWQSISFEQLIEEVCEGGDLFGEGHVDGLRAIFDRETLIDPNNPEFGPLSNQLIVTDAGNEGRTPLIRRFAEQSFGTMNRANHGSYCGQSFRIGAGQALGDVRGMPHGKPDWSNALFGLFIGAAPAQSGNPFQRQGRELAEARSRKENTFKYVVVSPVLPTSSSLASGSGNRWLAIKPATDLALVMAMLRWMLENERFDAVMLSQPGPEAMKAAGEASWCNATHLLINDPNHPRYGTFLRGSDLGWPINEVAEGEEQPEDVYVVQRADGSLAPHTIIEAAELFVEKEITAIGLGAQPVKVCTSLAKLREESQRMSFEEYSAICGVSVQDIQELAEEFTSYGKRAVVDAHGGTMSGSGFYTAYAIAMLNTLVGNLNVKGGLVLDAGPFGPFGPGPRYDFRFKGQAQPKGLALSRNRMAYEQSSEYKRRVAAGENPYPAPAPWYPIVGGALSSELIASGMAGYPYKAKAWINHMGNFLYGIAGMRNAMYEDLCDPKKLPLIVCIEPFINETSAIADYIVPDTVTYESWGVSAPWADVIAKTSTVRWPVVEPKVSRTADGQPISLESFLIAVAKRIGMPGFGEDAIGEPNSDKRYPLNSAADFYIRGFANIAYGMKRPVQDATDDDMALTGVDRYADTIKDRVKDEEWRKVATVMCRGGRFDKVEDAWDEGKGHLKHAHPHMLPVWDEKLFQSKHALTGENNSGCPTWYPTRLADGTPMREAFSESEWPFLMSSYKSNLMSSISIAVDRLRQVHPHNPISINREDANELGIKNGERIRLVTPGNSVEGVAMIRDGVMRGAIAIEHGYGHKELGARAHTIDGKAMPHNPALAAGVNINDLGFRDTTRGDHNNVWIDWVSGAVVRQGLPARIEKI